MATIPYPVPQHMIDRFWKLVDRGETDACWKWRGHCIPTPNKNYGRFYLSKKKRTIASHFAYVITNGPVPLGRVVCHSCDKPPCCNPAHLRVDTDKANAEESVAKGRRADFRGTRSPNSLFTADQVRTIRNQYASGNISTLTLAKEYQVGWTTMKRLVSRETYTLI